MPPTSFATALSTYRLTLYGALSTLLASAVIANAFRKHSNFYSAMVYLSRSSGSVMALSNFGIFASLVAGKVTQRIFFGSLRPVEVERLYDRIWYFLTESLLAFTIFRDEFNATFGFMFGGLLFFKSFHWLLSDRIEWMDQIPYPGPDIWFHLRTNVLFFWLWAVDVLMLMLVADNLLSYGVGGIILFGSEYGILLATLTNSMLKYGIILWDIRRARNRGGENAPVWENKSMWIFYVELATDFIKLITYLVFFAIVTTHYGLPLNIIRDVYITARSFYTRFRDLLRYRTATRNMDERYPNATRAELEAMSDCTCIICREEMTLPAEQPRAAGAVEGPNDTPKKLPCGHVFHFHCLRSWLERQQSCPTCRTSVLDAAPAPRANQAPPAPQPAQLPGPAPQPAANLGAPPVPEAALYDRFFGVPPVAPGQFADVPAQNPALPPAFQGFNAGGLWHPWNRAGNPGAAAAGPNQPPANANPAPTPTTPAFAAGPEPAPNNAPDISNPREAAARAALRRFESKDQVALRTPTATSPAPQPLSTHAPTPTSSAPPLIPLFDPSALSVPTFGGFDVPPISRFQPIGHQPLQPPGSYPQLPPTLTDEQLQRLDQMTRDGIDERLRVLENVQTTLWRCVEDIVRVRSVLPEPVRARDDTSAQTTAERESKGKERELIENAQAGPSSS
ncbi:hypothetical protein BOTBODRAFT_123891 [Botryobasidium botryosum FD-172 SS1]|uniref:RING-type E3 ubiquitin transferase n=1 Tax=Botryobasidium botryosum (strain FD-172 SS1) TaxID=930990 RepID=A0A067N4Q6_BOTB1|nr:hypothetical protein BOTBODRAFT_123891 [Botryobasidium botryosum FD-172 SS1]